MDNNCEDQQKFIVPLNRETEKLEYDQRLIIDARVITSPRTWRITKVNRLSPNGLNCITMAQIQFDPHLDYIELDDDGNVVGMWASYYTDGVIPENHQETNDPLVYSTITFSGANTPQLKIGGNAKTFTVGFFREGVSINHKPGNWICEIDDQDASDLVTVTEVSENRVKIKFVGDEDYIGKALVISYISDDGIKSSAEMKLVGI